jgi:hypothetical protein
MWHGATLPLSESGEANDPGIAAPPNQTTLILLGIPKLVRFAKIRPQ